MADKTKTIKGSSDKELDDLITRLRKENELQSLISDLKRKGSEGYTPYDYQQGVSTEVPIESLYHFGIPGMRWGHKRGVSPINKKLVTYNKGSILKSKDNANNSEDHNKKVALKKKKLSEMSNAELKALNERLQLEKQYKDLTRADISPGQKFVADILVNGAKQTAGNYAAKYMTKGVEAILKKAIK